MPGAWPNVGLVFCFVNLIAFEMFRVMLFSVNEILLLLAIIIFIIFFKLLWPVPGLMLTVALLVRCYVCSCHDDVIKWKHFPRYWPFLRNSPVPGEFPAQRPVTRNFDVFFDLRLNKRLSKQSWGWWFETPSWLLWRHRNAKHIATEMKSSSGNISALLALCEGSLWRHCNACYIGTVLYPTLGCDIQGFRAMG